MNISRDDIIGMKISNIYTIENFYESCPTCEVFFRLSNGISFTLPTNGFEWFSIEIPTNAYELKDSTTDAKKGIVSWWNLLGKTKPIVDDSVQRAKSSPIKSILCDYESTFDPDATYILLENGMSVHTRTFAMPGINVGLLINDQLPKDVEWKNYFNV